MYRMNVLFVADIILDFRLVLVVLPQEIYSGGRRPFKRHLEWTVSRPCQICSRQRLVSKSDMPKASGADFGEKEVVGPGLKVVGTGRLAGTGF